MITLAIFDFCETVVKYQTADRFVDFIVAKAKSKSSFWIGISNFLGNRIFTIFMGKFFPKLNFGKRVKWLKIRGLDTDELKYLSEIYAQEIKKDVVHEVVDKIQWHKSNSHHLVIISGGYENYLIYFKEIFGFDGVLGTQIAEGNGKLKGEFDGSDCMFEEKVYRLQAYLKENKLQVEESYCYTDSITDLPILQYSNHPYVISYKNSQTWAEKNEFKQIIWS